MTNREAFDRAKEHLLKQGRKSILPLPTGKTTCAYRGPGELKCAIGCLIPDAEYRPEFEARSASFVLERVPSLAGIDPVFIDELQKIHDDVDPWRWGRALDDLEEEWLRGGQFYGNR